MIARLVVRIHAGILMVWSCAAVVVWHRLPDRIPVHFGLAGRPDRWAETSVLSWFGLPATAIAITVAITLATRATMRHPEMWNLPRKAEFLALPAAARVPVEESLRCVMAWTSLLMTLTLAAVHANVYRAATQHLSQATPFGALLPMIPLAAMIFVVLAFAIRVQRQVRAATCASALAHQAVRPHGRH